MSNIYNNLKELLADPNTSDDTKEAIRKILADEKELHEKLAEDLDKALKK